jgi:hypothetical protein
MSNATPRPKTGRHIDEARRPVPIHEVTAAIVRGTQHAPRHLGRRTDATAVRELSYVATHPDEAVA